MFFVWILCKYSAVQYKMNIISKEFSMLRQGFNPRSEYDTIDEDGDALELMVHMTGRLYTITKKHLQGFTNLIY